MRTMLRSGEVAVHERVVLTAIESGARVDQHIDQGELMPCCRAIQDP